MTVPADLPKKKDRAASALSRGLIERYMDQPAELPEGVRRRVEAMWGGGPVMLYGLADLDENLRLGRTWVLLGGTHLALARESADGEDVRLVERRRVKSVRETPGLSCTALTLGAGPEEPSLAEWRYTHRQKRAMENVKFVLQQGIEEKEVRVEGDADEVYAEAVIGAVKDAQASVAKNQLAVVWRLLAYVRPYRWDVVIGMVSGALMMLVNLVPPKVTALAVDEVIRPATGGTLGQAEAMAYGWRLVAVLAFSLVLREIFGYIRLRKMAMLGEQVAHDLRRELYGHLQKLSLRFYSKKQTGSIISRVSSDTDRLWEFVAFGIVEVTLCVVLLIGLSVMMILTDWRLGLVLTAPVPLFLWAFYRHGEAIGLKFTRAWRKWSDLTAVLSDTIPGIRVVKAFSQEKREVKRFGERNADSLEAFNGVHRTWTVFWPQLMLGFHAVTLVFWCFALPRVLGTGGGAPLSTGTFIEFTLYLGMFFYPLEVIGQMTRIMNRAVSSAHRVFEILDTEPQVEVVEDAVRLENLKGEICFENVSFSYDGVRRVLQNVSFTIPAGKMVGLVGPSGSGKTTVTNLLARFYETQDGRITIDGVDVRQLELGHFRSQLGIVLQEPFLFHGTVLENIRYGNPQAAFGEVVEAARAANAHDFICQLPMGYETMVGERGHTLSGGERQRVSIARAILHSPRILILDEATSSVDTETERKIQEALDRLVSGRTVVAIAHRLSTLEKADRLVVLKGGQVAEEGTHLELLALEAGVYRKLHEMQQELHRGAGA